MPPPPRPKPTALLLFVSFLLVAFLYSLLYSSSPSQNAPPGRADASPSADHLRGLFLSLSAGANATIAAHLRALTLRPHLAGTPPASGVAAYVLSHLRLSGLETHTVEYSPLLSYPAAASLSLHRADGDLIRHLSLAEPAGSPTAAAAVVIPYHAYSPSGAVSAPAVYVNYGREDDYRSLRRMGVDVKGCVVVVRRGSGYRGAVVARAAEKGAAAVLMFKEGDAGGVERGTVLLGGTGDPLTPGWAATEGGSTERLSPEDEEVRRRFPKIPSMPVSEAVAAEILRTLGGPRLPREWRVKSTTAKETGVGAGPTLVNLTYQEERKLSTIHNIFGIIRGSEEPDRYVILGNHRDAWTYGAVDPNSGTSALLDVARRYGALLHSGWRPRRTIILCSWDAEEFGMIGSTEWVEQNIKNLGAKAVSYLNVDCAVQGSGFFAGATPQLDKLLIDVIKQVKDPDFDNRTVYDSWITKNQGISIDRLARADSDFSAFLHLAGIPSIDLYYGEEFSGYHTILDAYDWMEKHGDPNFHRHVAIAEIWGLLGLHLADDPFLPFDYLSYVAQLQEHISSLNGFMENVESLQPINTSIHDFTSAITEVFKEGKELMELDTGETIAALSRRSLNDRLMLGERGFLDAKGLRGRKWFKHLLYSPPEDSESKLAFFPGIVDAISESGNLDRLERQARIQHEVWEVARAIQRAAAIIRGELT